MDSDSTVTQIAHLLRLVFQAFFDGLGAVLPGLDRDQLKKEMLQHLQKRAEEAAATGESQETISLAMGILAVDPEFERLLVGIIKNRKVSN